MGLDHHHFRDDVPALAHHNGIPQPHILLGDVVLVVEGGPGDGGPRQLHRVKDGGRGKHPGASHRNFNLPEGGLLFLRGILKGHRPFRELGSGADGLPVCQVIHLHHGAIHIKGKALAQTADGFNLLLGLLGRLTEGVPGRDGKALFLQPVQAFLMAGKGDAPTLLDIEDKDRKPPLGGDGAVLLAQAACRCVSGVFKGGLPIGFLLPGQAGKGFLWHIHLAPDFQVLHRGFQPLGNGLNGEQILGHILPYKTIPPGRAPGKHPVFILQGNAQPVDLHLHHVGGIGDLADAVVEIVDLF